MKIIRHLLQNEKVNGILAYISFVANICWSLGIFGLIYVQFKSVGVASLIEFEALIGIFSCIIGFGQGQLVFSTYHSEDSSTRKQRLAHCALIICLATFIVGIAALILRSYTPSYSAWRYGLWVLLLSSTADALLGVVASHCKISGNAKIGGVILLGYYVSGLAAALYLYHLPLSSFLTYTYLIRAAFGLGISMWYFLTRSIGSFSLKMFKYNSVIGLSVVPSSFLGQCLITLPRLWIGGRIGMESLEKVALSLKMAGFLQALVYTPLSQAWMIAALRTRSTGVALTTFKPTAYLLTAGIFFSASLANTVGQIIINQLRLEQNIENSIVFFAVASLAACAFYNTGIYARQKLQLSLVIYFVSLATAGCLLLTSLGTTSLGTLICWSIGTLLLTFSARSVSNFVDNDSLPFKPFLFSASLFVLPMAFSTAINLSSIFGSTLSTFLLGSLLLLTLRSTNAQREIRFLSRLVIKEKANS